MRRRDVLAALLIVAGRPALAAAGPWPDAAWEPVTPEQAGWAPAPLAEARAYGQRAGTASCMILHQGRLVDSWGDVSRRLQLYSVRKSLLSALIGIAVGEGRIDLDATMAMLGIDDVAPSLTEVEKQATVRQLLQARSGVYHAALYETEGMRRRRPVRGSHPPGSFWYYNNWDFNVLGTIYERATGTSIFDAFQRQIAAPLGMQDYRPSDGRHLHGEGSQHAAYPFRMSARDLARFGLLYLRGGLWRDRQVVPAAWVRESTTGWSETYLGSGYGYLWWTGFPDRRVAIMNLAPGGFWADGSQGQFIIVDPAHDLVIVHQTDGTPVGERQMGHMMWLILNAARVQDPGADPEAGDR